MRHTKVASATLLLLLSVGAALSGCTATASEDAIPYGSAGYGPGYYSDSGYLGGAPLYGDFGFEGSFFDRDRGHDHHEFHHEISHAGPGRFAMHDGGHGFGHGGFGHAGFGHGGGGGGHGGGGHGR